MKTLTEMAVLVTGATSGMGLGAAKSLIRQGVRQLMVAGRNAGRGADAVRTLKLLAEESGRDADIAFVSADVATWEGARNSVSACVTRFGRIDALVNSAGAHGIPRLFHDADAAYIERVLTHLLNPNIYPTRIAIEYMEAQKSGVVVCVASDAGKLATPGEAIIGAAYGGTIMFCRALAMEAKRYGVRVNVVTPSVVANTLAMDAAMQDPFAAKLFSGAMKRASLGVVEPDDIGPLIAFLLSPEAAKITGQAISINGGISAA